MIPDAAVDAAYRELPDGAGVYVNRADLRVILEAAAPHMLAEAKAEAWDECERAEYVITLSADGTAWEPVKTNPYRSQA